MTLKAEKKFKVKLSGSVEFLPVRGRMGIQTIPIERVTDLKSIDTFLSKGSPSVALAVAAKQTMRSLGFRFFFLEMSAVKACT